MISDALGPMVVVDATNRVMTVPTHRLELRSDRPEAFSVVQRRTDDPNPVRGTPQDVGLQYAVCAPCGTRIRLSDESPELSCPACGHHARVTWDPRC